MTEILTSNVTEIIGNISVKPPYFSFENISIDDGGFLNARFSPELAHPYEKSPICMSEVGRHMAILGSLALSSSNPLKEQHYYLANHALVTRNISDETETQPLYGKVTDVSVSKRKGAIHSELCNEGNDILYTVDVDYTVIHHTSFERLFADKYFHDNAHYEVNPYTLNIEFEDIEYYENSCKTTLGKVLPFYCLGHFENYPALPVARLANALLNLAGAHMNHIKKSTNKYIVMKADISANTLAFVGEEVDLISELEAEQPEEGMCFKTSALNNNRYKIAEMTCCLL